MSLAISFFLRVMLSSLKLMPFGGFRKGARDDGRFVTNDLRRQFARLLVEVVFADANRTTRLQIDDVVVPGTLNFGDVGEVHAFALALMRSRVA